LTNNSVSDSYPALSPDGTKVAFTSYRNNNLDIYIMNAAPESVDNPAVRLTSASGYNYNARFDHAGDKIVFVTSRYTSTTEVCVMGIDGSNQTRVTNNTFGESNPSFSPDDAKIVYDSYRNNKTLVYAINADGTGETKLSPDTTTGDSEPIYSPDATTIAFTSSSSIFFHAAGRQ
jgi:TolB protein